MNLFRYCRPTLLSGALLAVSVPAAAEGARVPLVGYNEVPSVSTPAAGLLLADIDARAGRIAYELRFGGLEGTPTQAHIHIGQQHTNGGVSVFLCDSATNADPTGAAPPCPASGRVSGLITAGNVVGPSAQGLSPGEFAELVAAIRSGAAYVNVHSTRFPGGEIRGQFQRGTRAEPSAR